MNVRSTAGVIATAVALFVWGFIYWGFNPMPYGTWSTTPDDAAAQAQLREMFPQSGTYRVPGRNHNSERLDALLAEGPAAFVFIDQDPPAAVSPPMFIWGFIQNLTIAGILLVLMRFASTLKDRLRLAAWAGLASVAIIDWSDIIWWGMAIDWKFHQAFYDFTVWIVGALVISPFVTPVDSAPRATATEG